MTKVVFSFQWRIGSSSLLHRILHLFGNNKKVNLKFNLAKSYKSIHITSLIKESSDCLLILNIIVAT